MTSGETVAGWVAQALLPVRLRTFSLRRLRSFGHYELELEHVAEAFRLPSGHGEKRLEA
jgi:hypothetical protein